MLGKDNSEYDTNYELMIEYFSKVKDMIVEKTRKFYLCMTFI